MRLRSQGCITRFYYEYPSSRKVIMRLGVVSDDTATSDPYVAAVCQLGLSISPYCWPKCWTVLVIGSLKWYQESWRVQHWWPLHWLIDILSEGSEWRILRASRHSCVWYQCAESWCYIFRYKKVSMPSNCHWYFLHGQNWSGSRFRLSNIQLGSGRHFGWLWTCYLLTGFPAYCMVIFQEIRCNLHVGTRVLEYPGRK